MKVRLAIEKAIVACYLYDTKQYLVVTTTNHHHHQLPFSANVEHKTASAKPGCYIITAAYDNLTLNDFFVLIYTAISAQ